MFNWTEAQYAQLADGRKAALIEEIAHWMVAEYQRVDPEVTLAYARDFTARNLEVAWSWGLRHGDLLHKHVHVARAFGEDYFERLPHVGAMLKDPDLLDVTKLGWLDSWLETMAVKLMEGLLR